MLAFRFLGSGLIPVRILGRVCTGFFNKVYKGLWSSPGIRGNRKLGFMSFLGTPIAYQGYSGSSLTL